MKLKPTSSFAPSACRNRPSTAKGKLVTPVQNGPIKRRHSRETCGVSQLRENVRAGSRALSICRSHRHPSVCCTTTRRAERTDVVSAGRRPPPSRLRRETTRDPRRGSRACCGSVRVCGKSRRVRRSAFWRRLRAPVKRGSRRRRHWEGESQEVSHAGARFYVATAGFCRAFHPVNRRTTNFARAKQACRYYQTTLRGAPSESRADRSRTPVLPKRRLRRPRPGSTGSSSSSSSSNRWRTTRMPCGLRCVPAAGSVPSPGVSPRLESSSWRFLFFCRV